MANNEYKLSYTAQEIDEKLSSMPSVTSSTEIINNYQFKLIEEYNGYSLYRASFIDEEEKCLPLSTETIEYKIFIDNVEMSDSKLKALGTYNTRALGFGNEYLWATWVNAHDDYEWSTTVPEDDGTNICLFYNYGGHYDDERRREQLSLIIRNAPQLEVIEGQIISSLIPNVKLNFNSILDGGKNDDELYFQIVQPALIELKDNTKVCLTINDKDYIGYWHVLDVGYGAGQYIGNPQLSSYFIEDAGFYTGAMPHNNEDFFVVVSEYGSGYSSPDGSYYADYLTFAEIVLPDQVIDPNSKVSLSILSFDKFNKIKDSSLEESYLKNTNSIGGFIVGSNSSVIPNDGYAGMVVGDNNLSAGGLIVGSSCISDGDAIAVGFNAGADDGIVITRGDNIEAAFIEYWVDFDNNRLYFEGDKYEIEDALSPFGTFLKISKNNLDKQKLEELYNLDYEEYSWRFTSDYFVMQIDSEDFISENYPYSYSISLENYDYEVLSYVLSEQGICELVPIVVSDDGILLGEGCASSGSLAINGQALGDDNIAILGEASGRDAIAIGYDSEANGSYAVALQGQANGNYNIAIGAESNGQGNIAIGADLLTGSNSVMITTRSVGSNSVTLYTNSKEYQAQYGTHEFELDRSLNIDTYLTYYCYGYGSGSLDLYQDKDRDSYLGNISYKSTPEKRPPSYTMLPIVFYYSDDVLFGTIGAAGDLVTANWTSQSMGGLSSSDLKVNSIYQVSSCLVKVIEKSDNSITLSLMEFGEDFYRLVNYSDLSFYEVSNTAEFTKNFGHCTTTNSQYQTTLGKYNKAEDNALLVVGNGNSSIKSNALVIDYEGNTEISGSFKAKSFNCRQISKNYLSIQDSCNEDEYAIWIKNGEFLFTLVPVAVEVNTLPDQIEYHEGEKLNLEGLTFKAIYRNGESSVIEDYKLLSKPYALTKNDNIIKFQVNTPIAFEVDVEFIITDFDTSILQDFTYSIDSEGYYVIESWKQTLNGQSSSTMVLPDNALIKI